MARSRWRATARACVRIRISRHIISAGGTERVAAIATRAQNDWRNRTMAELDVRNVSLAFGGLQVLRDVSFSADAGELMALIGPNGAGKTSLFNCIGGIY